MKICKLLFNIDKLILTELGPFKRSNFDKFDQTEEF